MKRFFVIYDRVAKWLMLASFIGIVCLLCIPINIKGYSFWFVRDFYNASFFFKGMFNEYIVAAFLITRLVLAIIFVILSIIVLAINFMDDSYRIPYSITLIPLLILLLLTFVWRTHVSGPAPNPYSSFSVAITEACISFDKFNLYMGMYYFIPISIIGFICIILEILSALRYKIIKVD